MGLVARLSGAVLLALAICHPGEGAAQERYPSRPIKILVPYAPGGATDYAARLLADKAKVILGQNIVLENRIGAGGIVAIEEMARAKPDGYTLMIGNVSTNAITPVVSAKQMSIDYDRQVVAIARLLVTPSIFAVNADFPPRGFKDFLDYARKNPGQVRYSSTGIGAFTHFDMERLAKQEKLQLVHVPYKGGGAEAAKGLASGEVHVGSTSTPMALSLTKAGRIVPLATNNDVRLEGFPDVPTFAELGFPGQWTLNWSALIGPAAMPEAVVQTLHRAFTAAVKDPALVEAAAKTGTFIFPIDSPEETQAWLRAEVAKWRQIADEIKIDMERTN